MIGCHRLAAATLEPHQAGRKVLDVDRGRIPGAPLAFQVLTPGQKVIRTARCGPWPRAAHQPPGQIDDMHDLAMKRVTVCAHDDACVLVFRGGLSQLRDEARFIEVLQRDRNEPARPSQASG